MDLVDDEEFEVNYVVLGKDNKVYRWYYIVDI
jgi:hypothetical protein